jgi:hypothetical protein
LPPLSKDLEVTGLFLIEHWTKNKIHAIANRNTKILFV